MGAGASISDDEFIDKAAAQGRLGGGFDEARFDAEANADGKIPAAVWNAAITSTDSSVPSKSSNPLEPTLTGDASVEQAEATEFVAPVSVTNAKPDDTGDQDDDGGKIKFRERAASFLSLDQEGRDKHIAFVKDTIAAREKKRKSEAKARLKEANIDYSKTCAGTAADSKAEKAFTELMKEQDGKADLPEDEFAHLLVVMKEQDLPGGVYDALKVEGKWLKVEVIHGDGLPGVAWIHSFTCEEAFSRPRDYVEEVAEVTEEVDPYAGLSRCDMEDVIERIEAAINGGEEGVEPKTPLLVDTSADEKMRTFFKYSKCVVVELEQLSWSRKKQAAEKVTGAKVMEEARRRAVVAMKHGKTLVLDLGKMGSGCMLKDQWCKENTLDVRIFEAGGKKIISGKPKPFCKKMWKDAEKVSGEIVIDDKVGKLAKLLFGVGGTSSENLHAVFSSCFAF